MAKVTVDTRELKAFAKGLEKASKEIPKLMLEIATEIGNQFLQGVIDRTPETNNNHLKNSWKLKVEQKGNSYLATVYTDVEYVSLVEYGYRNGVDGFTKGAFMMHITESDMQNSKINSIAQKKLNMFLKEYF